MLSDKAILAAFERGDLIIEPFDRRQLGTNSYDCRLGEWYFEEDAIYAQDVHLANPDEARARWGEPRRALHGEIPIYPGGTILAHTLEVIGAQNGYTTSMRTRSTLARSCVDVCGSAGLGDVGYINKWTMEIRNHSFNTVWLAVGMRVCQIEFHRVGETLQAYHGSYKPHATWSAWEMLPSLKPDWAIEEYHSRRETRG